MKRPLRKSFDLLTGREKNWIWRVRTEVYLTGGFGNRGYFSIYDACVHNKQCREHWQQLRDEAIDMLGGKCALCNFEDRRALQFDHINNTGHEEREIMVSENGYLFRALKRGKFFRDILSKERTDIQLLCANCNAIKESERRKDLK